MTHRERPGEFSGQNTGGRSQNNQQCTASDSQHQPYRSEHAVISRSWPQFLAWYWKFHKWKYIFWNETKFQNFLWRVPSREGWKRRKRLWVSKQQRWRKVTTKRWKEPNRTGCRSRHLCYPLLGTSAEEGEGHTTCVPLPGTTQSPQQSPPGSLLLLGLEESQSFSSLFH